MINEFYYSIIICKIKGILSENHVYQDATEYYYPPFSVTSEGKADGFSVDLLKTVAQEMGFKVDFKTELDIFF
ncbi:MAG: transporter substrate-binding domain-containing protein [Eubacteriales bacterium]